MCKRSDPHSRCGWNWWQAYVELLDQQDTGAMVEWVENHDTPLFYRIRLVSDLKALARFECPDDAYNLYLWAHDQERRAKSRSRQLERRLFHLADYGKETYQEMRRIYG